MSKTEVSGSTTIMSEQQPNNITFENESQVMLELCANGDIKVKGKKVTNDKLVVDAFKEWFFKTIDEQFHSTNEYQDSAMEKFHEREKKNVN